MKKRAGGWRGAPGYHPAGSGEVKAGCQVWGLFGCRTALCSLVGGVSWEGQGHRRDKSSVRIQFKITFGQLDSARKPKGCPMRGWTPDLEVRQGLMAIDRDAVEESFALDGSYPRSKALATS